jgi:hypothetical protein
MKQNFCFFSCASICFPRFGLDLILLCHSFFRDLSCASPSLSPLPHLVSAAFHVFVLPVAPPWDVSASLSTCFRVASQSVILLPYCVLPSGPPPRSGFLRRRQDSLPRLPLLDFIRCLFSPSPFHFRVRSRSARPSAALSFFAAVGLRFGSRFQFCAHRRIRFQRLRIRRPGLIRSSRAGFRRQRREGVLLTVPGFNFRLVSSIFRLIHAPSGRSGSLVPTSSFSNRRHPVIVFPARLSFPCRQATPEFIFWAVRFLLPKP